VCLTAEAFRSFVRDNGLDFASAPLPAAVSEALEQAAAELRAAADGASAPLVLAVRSSATDEDAAATSFAGQHRTELRVRPGDLAGAVRRCWASLWSAGTAAYRDRHHMDAAGAAMAVVVQLLVDARASAVVFSVDPVSGLGDRLVIDATPGLGDALVSGRVTADTVVLDRATRAVIHTEFGDASAFDVAVTRGDCLELADLCLRAEEHLGRPVDVEAARSADRWWLVQARPITTIAPAAAEAVHA
jgi:pyruvate,water dikinase